MSEDKIPKQAGIGKLIDLGKNALNCGGVHASRNETGRSHLNTIAAIKVSKKYPLFAATLSATAFFTAAFNIAHFMAKASHINDYDKGFVVSLAIVISGLRSSPMKPWPQITVYMLLFSYVSLIMKILPWASMLVLAMSVPLLVLAAAGKVLKFDE